MFGLCPFFVMCVKYLEPVERDVKKTEWITFDLARRELFGWGLHLEGGKGLDKPARLTIVPNCQTRYKKKTNSETVTLSIRDEWRYQNGWIFGKVQMGDFGPLYRALKRAFQQKLRYNFPKMKGGGGGVKGCLEFFRKSPSWYLHLFYLSVKALLFFKFWLETIIFNCFLSPWSCRIGPSLVGFPPSWCLRLRLCCWLPSHIFVLSNQKIESTHICVSELLFSSTIIVFISSSSQGQYS